MDDSGQQAFWTNSSPAAVMMATPADRQEPPLPATACRTSTTRAFNAACFAIRRVTRRTPGGARLVSASVLVEPDVPSVRREELFLAAATVRAPAPNGQQAARRLERRGYVADLPRAAACLLRAVSIAAGVHDEPAVVDAIETVEASTP